MDDKLDKAIELLLAQGFRQGTSKPDEALKFSQSVLNLAHAKQILEGKAKKQGAGA